MKVKVFEIFKSGLSPLSEEMETIIQDWLNENDQIEYGLAAIKDVGKKFVEEVC